MRVAPRQTTLLQKVARATVGAFVLSLVFAPLVSFAQNTPQNQQPQPTTPSAAAGTVTSTLAAFPKKDSGMTEPQFEELVSECYGGKYEQGIWATCEMKAGNGDLMRCNQELGVAGAYPSCTFTYADGSPTWREVEEKFWGSGLKGEEYNAATGQAADTRSSDVDKCNLWQNSLLTCVSSVAGKLGASILLIFVLAFSAILGLVGGILNWVMLITVFQYSTYFGNSEGMLVAWSVLRDLGNIILLFGFIFIGLQTILNIGHFSVSKALPRLVIFAILINFSLFVSEAVVDVSNVFASTFYTQAGQIDCTDNANMEKCANDGIAGKIMKEAGLAGIFSSDSQLGGIWGATNGSDMFFLYFCLTILVLIMIVVFIAAIILFVIRAVVLMLLLVTSPIGFVGMAIPQLEEFSSMWWKKLISNAVFAPVFLLMLLVGLKIMDGASGIFNAGGASLTVALMQGSTGTGGIFILYSLIIGFMIAALISAKNLGAMGASFATRQAGGAVFGSLGFVGRRTLGVAAKQAGGVVAKNRRFIENIGVGKFKVGKNNTRALWKMTDDLHKSGFDARGGGVTAAALKATGLDFGKPGKTASHGLHGIEEKAVKDRENYAKNLKLDPEQTEELKKIRATIIDQGNADSKEMRELVAKLAGERAPLELKIADQRNKVDTAATPAARAVEVTQLNNLYQEYTVMREKQTKEENDVKGVQKTRMDDLKLQEKHAKEAPKRSYAEDLNKKTFYPPLSVGSHADHEASEKLVKDLDKSESEKLIDALKDTKTTIKEAKSDGHTSAPAAGGAAPH